MTQSRLVMIRAQILYIAYGLKKAGAPRAHYTNGVYSAAAINKRSPNCRLAGQADK